MVSLDHSASSLSFYLDYLSLFLADESLSIDAQKDEIAADNSDVSKKLSSHLVKRVERL